MRLFKLYSSPLELIKVANNTHKHVQEALNISNLSNITSIEEMINMFDDFSDKMCQITDSSECIRRLHFDLKWRGAATKSFEKVSTLMNELNCDKNLIEKFNSLPLYRGNDAEMISVIKSFKMDFDLFSSCTQKDEINQIRFLQSKVNAAEMEYEKMQNIQTLEKMIKARFEMSKALGYKNPTEIVLRDKQLTSSESVLQFLGNLPVNNHETVKKRFLRTNIKAIIDSLIKISKDFFGIEIELEPFTDLGRNLSFQFRVKDEQHNNNVLGNILFDITSRKNKDPHPTHYTIKCRKSSEPACILISIGIEDLENITWYQSSSLFHEFGHALHSVLSETKYQMLSGSRGPVDLAEIPSNFMEIVHETLQNELGKSEFIEIPGDKLRKEELFQLEIAKFDQLIHSVEPGDMNWARDIAHSIKKDSNNFPNWFCTIPHLATYGGTYFSYIYSKLIAESIWKLVRNDKVRGLETFKKEFLCRGGTAQIDFINKINNCP